MVNLQSVLGKSYILSEDRSSDVMERITKDCSREESSFYILNIEEVIKRLKAWCTKLPRVKPHYAVKCNDHPAVVKTLALLGTGFDCASRAEIKTVMSYGVKSSRIIYAHPCKIASHLKYARSVGVKKMTFDSEQELYKIAKLFPEAELLIRIRCDATSVQCELGIKFGVMPELARPLLNLARKLKLNVTGVAFHVGSGCSEPSVFERAIYESRKVFDEAKEEGHNPSIVDIGGGFLSGSFSHLDEAAEYINNALSLYFPEESGVRIIAEPGRYMVASAFSLCTPIINFKDATVSSSEVPRDLIADNGDFKDTVNTKMYYIDDGVYGSFNCVLYDHQVVKPIPLKTIKKKNSRNKFVSSIWGPTCDGFDQVMKAVLLPELAVGDWLMWKNMGAYTISAAGQFNGFSVPEVKVLINSAAEKFLEGKLHSNVSSNYRFLGPDHTCEGVRSVSRQPKSAATIKGMSQNQFTNYITAAVDSLSLDTSERNLAGGDTVSNYFSSDDHSSSAFSSSENVEI